MIKICFTPKNYYLDSFSFNAKRKKNTKDKLSIKVVKLLIL